MGIRTEYKNLPEYVGNPTLEHLNNVSKVLEDLPKPDKKLNENEIEEINKLLLGKKCRLSFETSQDALFVILSNYLRYVKQEARSLLEE